MLNFVIIALGSNLGDCLKNITDAYLGLFDFVNIKRISPIYISKALLPEGAPKEWDMDFYNSVICGHTKLSLEELHKRTKDIEENLGKNHRLSGKWAPRTIDIDIIAFNEEVIKSDALEIPHPRMADRDFVMLPLSDILPEWKHPLLNKTTCQIAAGLAEVSAKKLKLESNTKLQGILNITPDSFSDGGKYILAEDALRRVEELVSAGADIVDIGAESTRPEAETLKPEDEWQRLESIFSGISKFNKKPLISLDSRNFSTQEKASSFGIEIINDVSGFNDNRMKALAAGSGKKVIFMHSLTIPADKNITLPENEDSVKLVHDWAVGKIKELKEAGISKKNMIFDPGLGFGKTPKQSWELLRRVDEFKDLGVEILIGHSEKSFLSLFTDKKAGQRGSETLALSAILMHKNIDYLRVHDVRSHKEMMNVFK